ncbi:MAG: hypothetical protein WCS28_07125 [Thiomicrospira sp.]|jgi:hypothetical protein
MQRDTLLPLTLSALSFTLLSGCGGGSSSGSTPPPAPQEITLNADNYDDIAIGVSNQLNDFIQSLRTPLAANDSAGLIQAVLVQGVQTLLPDDAGQQAIADLVINQQACNSGEVNTDNSNGVRYQFNACVKNGYTFNGELHYQHTPGSNQASLNYNNLKAAFAQNQWVTLNGRKALTLTMEPANQRVRSEVSAGDLVASNPEGSSTQRQGYTQGYTRIGTEWRLSVNGTVQLTMSNQQQAQLHLSNASDLQGTVDNTQTPPKDQAPMFGDYAIVWNDSQKIGLNARGNGQINAAFYPQKDGAAQTQFTFWWDRTYPQ